MIKRIKCKTCDDDRDMTVCGDRFICTSCGTVHDLEYIATSFYTPLMIEISFMINDLNKLGGKPIDIPDEEELAPEFETSDGDELVLEDAELAVEEFLAAEEIGQVEKAQFCLYNYYYHAVEENSPDNASAFIDTVLRFDKTNFVACLIKALENCWSIPRYTISLTGNAPAESLDSLPVSFAGEDDVKFSQELFTRICNNDLAKHLQSILNLLLTSVRNTPSEELCRKAYHIASIILDLYEVLLQLNTLSNLKEMPTVDRYKEYLDRGLAMTECQTRLQKTATNRLVELDVSDVDLDGEQPHFQDNFPDIPKWSCHLAETEYRTAEEIWEKFVISNIDPQTAQVDDSHQMRVLDGIFVSGLLLSQYTNVEGEEVVNAGLHDLQIAQKMVKKLMEVIGAVESFSFRTLKVEDIIPSLGSAEELEKKLFIIEEELAKRV